MVHVLAEDFILRIYVIGTVAARFPKLGSAIKGIFFLGLGKGSLAASEIRTLVPEFVLAGCVFFRDDPGALQPKACPRISATQLVNVWPFFL